MSRHDAHTDLDVACGLDMMTAMRALLFLIAAALTAGAAEAIPLWPNGRPGEKGENRR